MPGIKPVWQYLIYYLIKKVKQSPQPSRQQPGSGQSLSHRDISWTAFVQKNKIVSDSSASTAMINHFFASMLWVKKNGLIWLGLSNALISTVKLKQFFHLYNTIMW